MKLRAPWIASTLHAYAQAHRIIWRTKVWRILLTPILLSAVYLALLLFGCYWIADRFAEWTVDIARTWLNVASWMATALKVVAFLLLGWAGLIIYRSVVLLFYAPFLDHASTIVERDVFVG